MIHILLLEDDVFQARGIMETIKAYDHEIDICYANDIIQATALLNEDISFDAFFIDISLDRKKKDCAGLDWANSLLETCRYQKTPICFITAFPEYVYQAINKTHCFSYILKPYTKTDIVSQLDMLFQKHQDITIKTTDNIYVSFPTTDLLYVQSRGRYLHFTTPASTYRSRQYTLKKLMPLLPPNFVRCHKSYIINKDYVTNYDFGNHYAHMKHAHQIIPLSREFHI